MQYVTGDTIRRLREVGGLTQRALAEKIGVTDKAVSKWETGRGLPDATLLADLAMALHVSMSELLTGAVVTNANRSANMRRSHFYLCPACGNAILTTGEASVSCCGITLPPLEPEEPDVAHRIEVSYDNAELFARLAHPMSKDHFVSFMAYVTDCRVEFRKLYPEQSCESTFAYQGRGDIYACCNRHGLFRLARVSA